MQSFTTACPRNCYSTCSMKVFVERGRLVRIESHPDNRATPGAVCLKGQSYVERVVSPHRLLRPMRRKPGRAEFLPISWDEALDAIVENLVRLRAQDGPQSVLYYSGSGTKGLLNRVGGSFWRLFGGCTTTYGDLCWPAGLEATRLTLGANKHSAPWDIENARLILVWGKNPAETNIHLVPLIERALAGGARLVVIDPRRTASSDRAELLVQPRPGTDGALALGMAHELVERGWIDREFVTRRVHGYSEFAAMLREFTPERCAEICGVSAGTIRHLAELVGTVKPVTINAGFGMQRYANGGQTMRALIALLAVTGNIGRPGAGWVYANLQSHIFDEIRDPLASYPPAAPDGITRVSISTARLGPDMLAQRDPPLRMMWCERGNPVTQNPETPTVLEAIRSLDFRVVVDEFLTDTAREADLVLPAKNFLEQTDVIGAYWHSYIQLRQKVLEPPAEVKPEFEIYWHLARRLGLSEEELRDRIPAPGDAAVEGFLRHLLAPFPELTLEKLAAGPILAPGTEEVAFSDGRFPTPSGKIELLSHEAQERWGVDPLPRYTEPAEAAASGARARYPLHFLTPNTQNSIHSQFNNLGLIRQFDPGPRLAMHQADAAARGIREGDRVRVFNDRGELSLPVVIDHGLRRGCVASPNGYWIQDGGTVNFLSAARETDMGYGAAFHENRVEVSR